MELSKSRKSNLSKSRKSQNDFLLPSDNFASEKILLKSDYVNKPLKSSKFLESKQSFERGIAKTPPIKPNRNYIRTPSPIHKSKISVKRGLKHNNLLKTELSREDYQNKIDLSIPMERIHSEER